VRLHCMCYNVPCPRAVKHNLKGLGIEEQFPSTAPNVTPHAYNNWIIKGTLEVSLFQTYTNTRSFKTQPT
jgi:hypothetical protein